MSCVKVPTMPSGFHPLSLKSMPYQPWGVAPNTIAVNSPTPTPATASTSSASLPTMSSRRMSRGYASEILPRLYISDLSFAESASLLSTHRITHILSTMPDTIAIPPETILYPQPKRLQIKVEDFPFAELAAFLPQTTKFIRDALRADPEARVLVHCAEGVSRSVSVVAAFLMAQYGWTPTEAIGFIRERRIVANPNFGFVQQLYEYGRDVLGQQWDIPSPIIPPYSTS